MDYSDENMFKVLSSISEQRIIKQLRKYRNGDKLVQLFKNSGTYKCLKDPSTGMYSESTPFIYSEFKREMYDRYSKKSTRNKGDLF
nr:MAG TPA: hypothetical protein [Caudoviricetes sp.]DAP06738.1 MAG TPA: hypothetical protein [Caudoviricetes sp.]